MAEIILGSVDSSVASSVGVVKSHKPKSVTIRNKNNSVKQRSSPMKKKQSSKTANKSGQKQPKVSPKKWYNVWVDRASSL